MNRRQEMRRWLALREREGLTYRELSQRAGIPSTTLSHWAWRLRREGAEAGTGAEQPAFVEIAPASEVTNGARVEIVTRSDRRVIADAGIAPEVLSRLVLALERC